MTQDPVKVIADSPLFDGQWYVARYPDIGPYLDQPAVHFLQIGAPLGRDPGPEFSSSGYLKRNEDVAKAGHNPLWHYELYGQFEGRLPSPSVPPWGGNDTGIAASEMASRRARHDDDCSISTLGQIFEQKLQGPPHRLLPEFDLGLTAAFVDQLQNQTSHALNARNTKASVIMPTHNRAHALRQAVASVLEQSHHNLELLIIDDGSTDDTNEVVQSFTDDPRVQYVQIPHGGVSVARNHGLEIATGEVIFYLDTDNRWTRDFVRLMLISLSVTDAKCAYSAARMHWDDGSIHGYRGEPFDWGYCLKGNYVDLNVFCHQRAVYEEYGGFDPVLRRMVDWDLILRYTRHNHPVYAPFLGSIYSDDAMDAKRISTSRPYVFKKVVEEKNIRGHESARETIKNLCFSIALKAPDDALTTVSDRAKSLAVALKSLGHSIRLDPRFAWHQRHAHHDDVVLVLDGASDYRPHPEQITIAVGADQLAETPIADLAQTLTNNIRSFLETGAFPMHS